MKLYKFTRPTDSHNTFEGAVVYAGSQADARKALIEMETPFKHLKPKDRPEVTVEEVEVPTDKKGLIEFLNGLEG